MQVQKVKMILLLDIIVQLLFIACLFLFREASIWFFFIGGAWQLISNYYHMKSFEKTALRKLYWRFAWWVVGVLLLAGISMILIKYFAFDFLGLVVVAGLYIGLFGGGVLYIAYLLISGFDFISITNKK